MCSGSRNTDLILREIGRVFFGDTNWLGLRREVFFCFFTLVIN
jgi:hypothetical protein